MIIDIHYHHLVAAPDATIEPTLAEPLRVAKLRNQEVEMSDFIQRAKDLWPDPDGSKLIANMDKAGVDYTVICVVDNAEVEVLTTEIVLMLNRMAGEVAQKYPDRVIAFAGVDPRRDNAVEIIQQCFDEFKMKGLKYHPDSGYDPSSPESYKLLEIVQGNGGVLLSHTGPLAPPARCNFADPSRLADIGVDFPDLKIIAAHMGYVNWRSWAALAVISRICTVTLPCGTRMPWDDMIYSAVNCGILLISLGLIKSCSVQTIRSTWSPDRPKNGFS